MEAHPRQRREPRLCVATRQLTMLTLSRSGVHRQPGRRSRLSSGQRRRPPGDDRGCLNDPDTAERRPGVIGSAEVMKSRRRPWGDAGCAHDAAVRARPGFVAVAGLMPPPATGAPGARSPGLRERCPSGTGHGRIGGDRRPQPRRGFVPVAREFTPGRAPAMTALHPQSPSTPGGRRHPDRRTKRHRSWAAPVPGSNEPTP